MNLQAGFVQVAVILILVVVLVGCPHPMIGDAGPDPAISACANSLSCNPVSNLGCDSGTSCFVQGDLTMSSNVACGSPEASGFRAVGVGEHCGAATDAGVICAPGNVCQNGECRRLCCTQDTQACADLPSGSTCIVAQNESGIGTCDRNCDWANQTGCGPGETCTAGGNGHSFCVPTGPLFEYAVCPGDTIHPSYECYPGTLCTLASATGSGQHRCIKIGSAATCPAGYAFVPSTATGLPTGFGHCFLNCSAPGTCPQGSQCQNVTFSGTSYAICYGQ